MCTIPWPFQMKTLIEAVLQFASNDQSHVETRESAHEIVAHSCPCIHSPFHVLAVQNNNTEDGVQFILHKERRQERLRVVNANLYLLVRYRKRPKVKGSKHTSKRVRIKILNAPLHKKAPDLLTTLDVDVRHTRWQNLILPTSVIQEVLDSDDNVLRLRIQCEDCGSDVSPVLVKRKPRNSQKRGRRKSRRGSRKSRRNSRRAAPALKGLHLRRVGGNKDDADGDAEGPANSRDNHRFGDIRDQIKSKKKIHKRRPFLVIHTRAGAHSEAPLKKKRSIKCNQQGVGACTKRPFFVDFAEFGWNDWILFPQGYNANYCDGQCKNLLLPSSLNAHHSTILDSFMSTFHVAKGAPENDGSHCCSNTLYSPLSILFLDEFNNLVKADLPNMIVEECGCAWHFLVQSTKITVRSKRPQIHVQLSRGLIQSACDVGLQHGKWSRPVQQTTYHCRSIDYFHFTLPSFELLCMNAVEFLRWSAKLRNSA